MVSSVKISDISICDQASNYTIWYLDKMSLGIEGQIRQSDTAASCPPITPSMMFVPIEGALAAALTGEPELFIYAWDRRVVLVGPPTLLMTMRIVASIWRYELQGQNAQEIARLAGDLCDKVILSLLDLNLVGEKITGALNAHNDAVKRLSTGKGNALSVGERIRSLGVTTKRPMPSMLVDSVAIMPAIEDSDENVSPAG